MMFCLGNHFVVFVCLFGEHGCVCRVSVGLCLLFLALLSPRKKWLPVCFVFVLSPTRAIALACHAVIKVAWFH